MKSFNKLSLALSLSLVGALSSISALSIATEPEHIIHKIEVEVENEQDATISVNMNGEMTTVSVPKSALHDREKLEEALVDVPAELKEKLVSALANLHISDKSIKVKHHLGDEVSSAWSSEEGQEHVVVIDVNEDGEHNMERVMQNVVMHKSGDKAFAFKIDGHVNADHIIKLMQRGTYSADDLNKIQQALDAKR